VIVIDVLLAHPAQADRASSVAIFQDQAVIFRGQVEAVLESHCAVLAVRRAEAPVTVSPARLQAQRADAPIQFTIEPLDILVT
jgi:hypothetical protein